MATQPSLSAYTFSTTKRIFSRSNINFYGVFYLVLIFLIFFLGFNNSELVLEGCCYGRNFSVFIDALLILSTDNIIALTTILCKVSVGES